MSEKYHELRIINVNNQGYIQNKQTSSDFGEVIVSNRLKHSEWLNNLFLHISEIKAEAMWHQVNEWQ